MNDFSTIKNNCHLRQKLFIYKNLFECCTREYPKFWLLGPFGEMDTASKYAKTSILPIKEQYWGQSPQNSVAKAPC